MKTYGENYFVPFQRQFKNILFFRSWFITQFKLAYILRVFIR